MADLMRHRFRRTPPNETRRPAPKSGPADPSSIWEQHKKSRIAEIALETKRRALRQQVQQDRGVIGLAVLQLRRRWRQLKTVLFGRRAASSGWLRDKLMLYPRRLFTLVTPHKPAGPASAAKPKPRLKRSQVLGGGIGLVALCAIGYVLINRPAASQPSNEAVATPSVVPAPAPDDLPRGTPDYKTLTPQGANIRQYGGWTRVSPPKSDPVYAYTDTVGKVPITVSQQPIPDGFQGGDINAQVEQLAKSFKASRKISVNGTPAFIGSSTKGPQSIIASKSDVLILIKSTAPLLDQQWVDYLASLR